MNKLELPIQLLAYLPTSTRVTVSEILDSMRRWELRNENHHNEKRSGDRVPYDSWVAIVVPVNLDLQLFSVPTSLFVLLRGRNVSTSGISVIGSSRLEPVAITDYTPVIKFKQLIREGTSCSIGLSHNHGLNLNWLNAKVVRTRDTQADLIEIGLQFQGKLPADHSIFRDAEQLFKLLQDN